MSALAKVKLDTVGVAEDKSFPSQQNAGEMVQCYEIPCTGTVNGAPTTFRVKVYGKGSDRKVVQGLEFNGVRSEYQGVVSYALKKANNPELYASGNYGNKGFKGGFKPQHELNALKVSADVVVASLQSGRYEEALPSAAELADEIIKIANDKFVPFLRATTERHDTVAERDEAKKVQAATIRQLLQTNNLIPNVQAAKATNGQLAAMFEAAGCDAAKFVQEVRAKFNAPPPTPADVPDEDEDDIPF